LQLRTPLVLCKLPNDPQMQMNDRQIFIKPENLQPVGSFKLRGAYNKISSLSMEERKRALQRQPCAGCGMFGNYGLAVAPFATLSLEKWKPRNSRNHGGENAEIASAAAAMPRAMGSQLETP
jgi:hypothetical protein